MKSVLAYVLAALMLSYVAAADDEQSVFRGSTPFNSWKGMSDNNNPWDSGSTAGAIIGFAVFGLSYIYVVIMIFADINKSKNDYIEMVEDDKRIIS